MGGGLTLETVLDGQVEVAGNKISVSEHLEGSWLDAQQGRGSVRRGEPLHGDEVRAEQERRVGDVRCVRLAVEHQVAFRDSRVVHERSDMAAEPRDAAEIARPEVFAWCGATGAERRGRERIALSKIASYDVISSIKSSSLSIAIRE